jgi:hypothetical protein
VPEGTVVRAVHGGTVAFAGPFTGFGTLCHRRSRGERFHALWVAGLGCGGPGGGPGGRGRGRPDRNRPGCDSGALFRGPNRRSFGRSPTMVETALVWGSLA